MIDAIKTGLEPLLAEHNGRTGLFLSGGSDSVLLLNILLDMQAKFSCVSLDHTFSQAQKGVIDALTMKHGLRVFSYFPYAMYFIGKGTKVSLVEEYAVPRTLMPVIRDCRHDPTLCIHDTKLQLVSQPVAPIGFTLNLFGTRKTDRHYSNKRAWKENTFAHDGISYHAPLWELTRKDVKECLAKYSVKPEKIDTGEHSMCLSCMTAKETVKCPKGGVVEPFQWSPENNLQIFRTRHGTI